MKAILVLLALCAVSALASDAYLRAPFAQSNCLGGNDGSISWWNTWSTMGFINQNLYCMGTGFTWRFFKTTGITAQRTAGIERALPPPPPGLAYHNITLLGVSIQKKRQQSGCPVNPPTTYPFPTLLLDISADGQNYVNVPIYPTLTTTPQDIQVDVSGTLFDQFITAPTIRLWNGPFAAACVVNGAPVSDVLVVQGVRVDAEEAPFTYGY
jgi:hypothetical protein